MVDFFSFHIALSSVGNHVPHYVHLSVSLGTSYKLVHLLTVMPAVRMNMVLLSSKWKYFFLYTLLQLYVLLHVEMLIHELSFLFIITWVAKACTVIEVFTLTISAC